MFPGVTDYGNYNGYNLRYVPDLHRALVHYGWSASSSGQWCGSAGQVCYLLSILLRVTVPLERIESHSSWERKNIHIKVCTNFVILSHLVDFCTVQVLIYNGDEHAALAIGNCLLDQHNPARCGSGAQWGSNIVLKP